MNTDPTIINNNTNNDAHVLETYLNLVDKDNKFYIDIGSSFEYNLSRQRIYDSSQTIFFECEPQKVANFRRSDPLSTSNLTNFVLIDDKVTPRNIVGHIQNVTDNPNPKLIDLDIDGYDYFVLESILEAGIRPSLILTEINEKIPTPLKYTTKYFFDYYHDQNAHPVHGFAYGMSLSKFYELANKYDYDVINLTFNNVYAVRKDKNPGLKAFEEQELYDTFYKKPRLAGQAPMFYYNEAVDQLLTKSPEEALSWIRNYCDMHGFRGFYELSL
tara:strand:+ start:6851 stop:7666 length:816 start_codon:yes stop_codon:yes gene_type:complete